MPPICFSTMWSMSQPDFPSPLPRFLTVLSTPLAFSAVATTGTLSPAFRNASDSAFSEEKPKLFSQIFLYFSLPSLNAETRSGSVPLKRGVKTSRPAPPARSCASLTQGPMPFSSGRAKLSSCTTSSSRPSPKGTSRTTFIPGGRRTGACAAGLSVIGAGASPSGWRWIVLGCAAPSAGMGRPAAKAAAAPSAARSSASVSPSVGVGPPLASGRSACCTTCATSCAISAVPLRVSGRYRPAPNTMSEPVAKALAPKARATSWARASSWTRTWPRSRPNAASSRPRRSAPIACPPPARVGANAAICGAERASAGATWGLAGTGRATGSIRRPLMSRPPAGSGPRATGPNAPRPPPQRPPGHAAGPPPSPA